MDMPLHQFPLLADGLGTVISVVFLLIAFISWISNTFANAANAGPAKNRPRPGPGGKQQRSLQQEIENFLADVNQDAARKQPQADRRPPEAGRRPSRPERTAPVRQGERRERPRAQPERRERPPRQDLQSGETTQRREAQPKHAPMRKTPAAAQTAKPAAPVFVEEPRSTMEVDAFGDFHGGELPHLHSALDVPGDFASTGATAGGHLPLLLQMATPQGMVQAILAQEILGKPVALRKR